MPIRPTTYVANSGQALQQGDAIGWITAPEDASYYPLNLSQELLNGAFLMGTAVLKLPLEGEGEGEITQSNWMYKQPDKLDTDVIVTYTAIDALQVLIVFVSGDKTVEVEAMKSKIKKIKINGQDGSTNVLKDLKKINKHTKNMGVALTDVG